MRIERPTIHKLLEEDLYVRKSLSLKKLLGLNTSRNIKMRIFRKQKDTDFKKVVKENKKKEIDFSVYVGTKKQYLNDLNESIINLFHQTYHSQNKAKKNYEQKKIGNDLFIKRLNNMKKFEIEKAKLDIKSSNSGISFNQNLNLFNDLVNQYKVRDGVSYSKDIFKKDIYQETPILANDRDKIINYYICNYDKYLKKTNIDNNEKSEIKKKNKNKSKKKNKNKNKNKKKEKPEEKKKEINFNNLLVTNFYKKLFFISQKKIYDMKDKEFDPNKFQYNFKYEGDKEKKNPNEIPKLRKEINNLNSLFNSMQNIKVKNINNNLLEKYNTANKTNKKILKKKIFINKLKEKLADFSNEFPSTKRSAEIEKNNQNTKSQINILRNIKLLSPKSRKEPENKNKNNEQNLSILSPLSRTQKNFSNINQNKDDKSVMSQKTKTTFYSNKNKKDVMPPLTPRYEISHLIDINNEEINESKDAYEELKLVTISNKKLIFDKIEQYFESKGYNVEKLKNSINKEDLYNYLDKIRNVVDNYHCKSKVNELYSNIGKKVSEKTFINLNEINQMDKDISLAEKHYFVTLLKG